MQFLQDCSWKPNLRRVYAFLGFIHKFMGIDVPALEHFLNPFLLVNLLAFLNAR